MRVQVKKRGNSVGTGTRLVTAASSLPIDQAFDVREKEKRSLSTR